MKKIMILLMHVTCITGNLCAQTSISDNSFKVPDHIVMSRRFDVKLGKGNLMKMEFTAIEDLETMKNIDSLLQVFLTDILPLKDSLSNPLTSKRIDYVTDAEGRKKIRFQQFAEKGASFLISDGELASLRTAQDTINLIGVIKNPARSSKEKISRNNARYYHFTFYLNDLNELGTYRNGLLANKISFIQQHITGKWPTVLGSGSHYMKADHSITADKARGVTQQAYGGGSFVNFNWSVNMQNYKKYFVPSFSLGSKFTFSNRDRNFKREVGLYWEPHFLFSADSSGKLHTHRNDFLTLTFGQGGTTDHDPKKPFSFSAVFSLGYLIRRNGEFITKNTFRLGGGKIQMQKTSVEPSLWFNNSFKGVTPGIRITQYF